MVSAFSAPERNEIVHSHPRAHLVVQDTGLDIERTDDVVVVQITSPPRRRDQKQAFFVGLAESLLKHCDLRPDELVVTITENTDEDWSPGHGRAQFVTGEL